MVNRKHLSQNVAFGLFRLLSLSVVGILFAILGFIIYKGIGVIDWEFLTTAPTNGMTAGGILPAIVGTFCLMAGSALFAFPVGVMSGIYMNEYVPKGWVVRFIRMMTNMVFQRPNPFPKSIFENVAYGLRVNGITDNAFIRQRVEETLKGAALWDEVKDKLKVSAYALSGGQQQRLCIARAMAVSPSVLLMDEPASALDPISTAKVEELIHELKKQYTIVIVTHNMQQAARVSDNTAFFYMGQMVEFGDTRKIFTNPDKVETQNYITGRFG